MIFRGLEPVSLIEFPGHISSVLFTGGCNFRCPFCHNARLVLEPEGLPRFEAAKVLRLLEQRRGLVDGVVISGGEPTLHAGLAPFLHQVKQLGLAVKLDTNGSRPDMLRFLLAENLLDYVAMDIKASFERYPEVAGVDLDVRSIRESIALIMAADVEYEFRTTVVPGVVMEKEIRAIASLIPGARRYCLQQFRPGDTLSRRMRRIAPLSRERMLRLAEGARQFVRCVEMRGV